MEISEYLVAPAAKADIDGLLQTLAQFKIPYTDTMEGRTRIIRLGPDAEYEVRTKAGRTGVGEVSMAIRYEQPVLKKLLGDWMDKCDIESEDGFHTWHQSLSPSILRAVKARWRVDLTGLPATPARFGQSVVLFVINRNVAAELGAQLGAIPHRAMAREEFIKCEDFNACGDDPFDTIVYGWHSEAGSRLFAVVASAPAITLLSLWVIPEGAPVECNIGPLPG